MPYYTDKLTMVTRTDGHLVSLGSQLPGRSRKRAMEQTAGKTIQTRPLMLAADSLAQEGSPMEANTTTICSCQKGGYRGPTQDSSKLLEIET